MSRAALHLRIFGLGMLGDDKEGTKRLLGENLTSINSAILCEQAGGELAVSVAGEQLMVKPDVYIAVDTAALRHCERLMNSGWCKCPRDFALRTLPARKPSTVQEMDEDLKICQPHNREDRYVLGHCLLPGESCPRPCTATRCTFAHNPDTAMDELAELLAEEKLLAADKTKAGKARFSRWRSAHAQSHFNVQPGLHGEPLFQHSLQKSILEPLHVSRLNLPKIPWKHGILNNWLRRRACGNI